MRTLRIANPDLKDFQRTYLDADYATSAITLVVKSNASFQANDLVIVGNPGEEVTELKKITGITNKDTINLSSAMSFVHQKGAPIYLAPWDFIEISRLPSGGSWAVISDSGIQWENLKTIFMDWDGVSTSSYRWRFQNTGQSQYSEYSPTVTGAGFVKKSAGYMIARVRKLVGDEQERIVSSLEIIRFLNKAQDIIYGIRSNWWFLRVDTFKAGTGITSTTSERYSLSTYTDLAYIDTMLYHENHDSVNQLYHLTYKPPLEFDYLVRDRAATKDDAVLNYTIVPPDSSSDQGYFRVQPTALTAANGTFYPVYYKKMTDLSGVASTTSVPIPSIMEDFAVAMIERIKGNETKARLYESLFYGTDPRHRDSDKLSGISLLEQLQRNSGRATGQPRAIFSFQGRAPLTRLFNDRFINRDDMAERYFN